MPEPQPMLSGYQDFVPPFETRPARTSPSGQILTFLDKTDIVVLPRGNVIQPDENNMRKPLILVVDDQSVMRKLARAVLSSIGFGSVLDAGDAESAIEIVRNTRQPIDIVISDINLGLGMNGLQLADAL